MYAPDIAGYYQVLGSRPQGKTVTGPPGADSVVEKLRTAWGKKSSAGVLRLRATSAVSRDKSVRRSAQDDDSVGVSTKNTLSKLARMRHRRTLLSSRPQWRNLQFPATVSEGGFPLLHLVFDSLDRVAKNLLQAHGSRTVALSEVFVDLIPIIHPWPRKAN